MTLPTLQSWPDFDDECDLNGATIIGGGKDCDTFAFVLDGPHHDEFLRLALAAPDMFSTLKLALEAISAAPNYRVPGHTGGSYAIASLIEQALTKAKGA
jgi:hypothetical protein